MSYANRKQMSSNRTAAIIIVALIHIALGYALVTGLAYNVIKKAAEDLKTFDVEEEPPPPPEEPPPPPDQNTPPPPQVVAPPSIVRIESPAAPIVTTPVIQPVVITPRAEPPATKSCPGGMTVLVSQACPVVKSQAAKAKGNLLSLITDDDYPQSAIRNEEQGTTAVRLSIGTDGRVTDCAITQSSGSNALDNTACSIFRRRARFTPAQDSAGNPTTDTYTQRVKWVLPAD